MSGTYVGDEYIPSNFNSWPSENQYLSGLVESLDGMFPLTDSVFDEGGVFNPPLVAHVTTLRSVIESASGASFEHLAGLAKQVAVLSSEPKASVAIQAVSNLIEGAIEVVASVAEALDVAADFVDIVPVIGQVISAVLSIARSIAGAFEAAAAAKEECKIRARHQLNRYCKELLKQQRVASTMQQHVMPADAFRPLLYNRTRGAPLPINLMSIYVALCGGEAQDFSVMSRDRWKDFVLKHRKKTGLSYLGISQDVQRRMWTTCKGIMAAVNEPGIATSVTGDNGKALMPILQDTCWNLLRAGESKVSKRDNFGLTRQMVAELYRRIISRWGGQHFICDDLGASTYEPGCITRISGSSLEAKFYAMLSKYKQQLQQLGILSNDAKTWNMHVIPSAAKQLGITMQKPKGLLVLSSSSLKSIGSKSKMLVKAKKRQEGKKAAIATTTVVLGAGGLFFGRRLAGRH